MTPLFINSGSTNAIVAVNAAFDQLSQIAIGNAGVKSVLDYASMGNGGLINVAFVSSSEDEDAGFSWNPTTKVLTVDQDKLTVSLHDTQSAGNTNQPGDLTRTIFHELFHAASIANSVEQQSYGFTVDSRVNFSEAAAIFSENLIYVGAVGGVTRQGHSSWNGLSDQPGSAAYQKGESGLGAFAWISSTVGPTFLDYGEGIMFGKVSDDGTKSVLKTYHGSAAENGFLPHYISVEGFDNQGFLRVNTPTSGSPSVALTEGATKISDTLMGGRAAGVQSAASAALTTIAAFDFIVDASLSQTDIVGLSGERFYERQKMNDGTYRMYDFVGVNYRILDLGNHETQAWSSSNIIVTAHESDSGTIVVGGASTAVSAKTSADMLFGGSGDDLLISTATIGGSSLDGGSGNDILISSGLSGDVLSGGAGNDLLIGRTKGAFYDGGSDNDVLSYYDLGTSTPITMNASFHAVSSSRGTDNYANIETLIGTRGMDVFNLSAGHPTIYGGAGSDKFYGKPTAPIYAGTGSDILDLTGSNTPLHTADIILDSIETIRGSDGADVFSGVNGVIFKNLDAGYTPSIYGGGGNDYVEVRGTINVRGEGGNDTVVIFGDGYGILDGGDDFDTLDFSRFEASRLIVTLDGASNGTYRTGTGDSHGFKNFEEVKFGSVTLQLHGSGTFSAGTGYNTVSGSNGVDDVTVGGTGGYVRTYGGDDIIHSTGLESVYGEMGNDRLFAGDTVGAKLNGGVYPDQYVKGVNDGNDYLQGGAMADVLNGGTGINELRGGGGYDHFYSGGYGENTVYGEGDLGAMHYTFAAHGGHPSDPDLVSIQNMGGWFDVVTTPDHGQTFMTDHLYDINKVIFDDVSYDLYSGFTYPISDFLI